MTTAIAEPRSVKPSVPQAVAESSRLILGDVSWLSYVDIGRALADRPALRLTYDRGTLEFMTTSPKHEIYKKWLGRLVEVMAEELNRPIVTAGNMTFQREDLGRGLEADDCFWIAHEPAMRGKTTWDPALDPPPDLALEIEISRSALGRMDIYAALRVSEVWRFDGHVIRIYLLQSDGSYLASDRSLSFPGIPVAELSRFLMLDPQIDSLTAIRAFRAWLRQLLGPSP